MANKTISDLTAASTVANTDYFMMENTTGTYKVSGDKVMNNYTAGDNITITNNEISADVPTKTSDLTNDSGFLTSHQSLSAYRTSAAQDVIDNGKQATLTAGTGISITNNTVASKTTFSLSGTTLTITQTS